MKGSDQTKDWTWDFSWDTVLKPAARLCLNTLDFSDLWDDEDTGENQETQPSSSISTCPKWTLAPPPPPPLPPPLPPLATPLPGSPKGEVSKSRTLKLHWNELQNLTPLPRMTRFGTQTIWAGLEPVHLDTNRLEYLFESKTSNTSFSVVSCRQVRLMRWKDVSKLHFCTAKDLIKMYGKHRATIQPSEFPLK